MKLVTTSFEKAAQQLERTVKSNTQVFGQTIANTFVRTARGDIRWTDRKGRARRGLFANVETGTANVTITMGGKADNYKRKSQYDDYMEILEFGYLSKKRNFPNLAVVYPTFESIKADVAKQYGSAALSGGKYSLKRSKAAARSRAKAARERNKGK